MAADTAGSPQTSNIGRAVEAPVIINHHKCTLPETFGRSTDTLRLIDSAAATQQIAFDIYPSRRVPPP
jgi:N-acyl-D-amino-acid deacylase